MEQEAGHAIRMIDVFRRVNGKLYAFQRLGSVPKQGLHKLSHLVNQCPTLDHLAVLVQQDISRHELVQQGNLGHTRDRGLINASIFRHTRLHIMKDEFQSAVFHGKHFAILRYDLISGVVNQVSVPCRRFEERVLGFGVQSLDDISVAHFCNPGFHYVSVRIQQVNGRVCQLVEGQVILQVYLQLGNRVLKYLCIVQGLPLVIIHPVFKVYDYYLGGTVVPIRRLCLLNAVNAHRQVCSKFCHAVFAGHCGFNLCSRFVNQSSKDVINILFCIQRILCALSRIAGTVVQALLHNGEPNALAERPYLLIVRIRYRDVRQIVRCAVRVLRVLRIYHRNGYSVHHYDVVILGSCSGILRNHILIGNGHSLTNRQVSDIHV